MSEQPKQQSIATFKRVNAGGSGERIAVDWLVPQDSLPDVGALAVVPEPADGLIYEAVSRRTAPADLVAAADAGTAAVARTAKRELLMDAVQEFRTADRRELRSIMTRIMDLAGLNEKGQAK